MNPFMLACGGGLVALLVLVGGALIALFNRLVVLRNRVENAWAQIDTQLKRRYDLIPNLVETVKAYAAHEKETLERVVQARQTAMAAQGPAQQGQAENMLTGALRQLFALAEQYPDLKANENFSKLQDELSDTEDKISYARQFYNDSVMTFNTAIQTFPSNLLAPMMGFTTKDYFEIDAAERENVQVKF